MAMWTWSTHAVVPCGAREGARRRGHQGRLHHWRALLCVLLLRLCLRLRLFSPAEPGAHLLGLVLLVGRSERGSGRFLQGALENRRADGLHPSAEGEPARPPRCRLRRARVCSSEVCARTRGSGSLTCGRGRPREQLHCCTSAQECVQQLALGAWRIPSPRRRKRGAARVPPPPSHPACVSGCASCAPGCCCSRARVTSRCRSRVSSAARRSGRWSASSRRSAISTCCSGFARRRQRRGASPRAAAPSWRPCSQRAPAPSAAMVSRRPPLHQPSPGEVGHLTCSRPQEVVRPPPLPAGPGRAPQRLQAPGSAAAAAALASLRAVPSAPATPRRTAAGAEAPAARGERQLGARSSKQQRAIHTADCSSATAWCSHADGARRAGAMTCPLTPPRCPQHCRHVRGEGRHRADGAGARGRQPAAGGARERDRPRRCAPRRAGTRLPRPRRERPRARLQVLVRVHACA